MENQDAINLEIEKIAAIGELLLIADDSITKQAANTLGDMLCDAARGVRKAQNTP